MIMTMIREEMKRDGWQCSWHPRPLLKMTQPYTSVIMMVMKMMMQMAMVMFRVMVMMMGMKMVRLMVRIAGMKNQGWQISPPS